MKTQLFQFLGIPTQGYDRILLHWAGMEKPETIWLVILLLGLFSASAYFMVKPLAGLKRKLLILSLHLLSLLVGLIIFLEPELRLAQTATLKSQIAILIDSSESMKAKTTEDQTRFSQALNWLKKNQDYFESLKKDYEIRWFSFDERTKALPANFLNQPELNPEGAQTQILEAITELKAELGNKPLSGVIFISDGADQGELRDFAEKTSSREKTQRQKELKKRLEGLGKIYPVLAGSDKEIKDLAITGLQHDGYGFVKNPFVVVVKVRLLGEFTSEVPLRLYQEDKLILTKSVKLSSNKEETVELEFIPDQVGRFLFRVELPIYPDEVSNENNQRIFPLTILRDRIRVLYIVGNPSWDEKFLRRTLEKNPAVDLVSFYILREIFDYPQASESELALIPFPTQELFQKELPNFDLVIFQNFFGKVYMTNSYMQNLRDYVIEKGGAFIYIGGPRAFIKDDFNNPLEEILPVDFSFMENNYQISKLSLKLTDAGSQHPITALAGSEMENQALWRGLNVLENYNQVLRVKPDAVVLVEHEQSNPGVLIAVREVGAGRVLMIATDSLWRWRFQLEGEQGEGRYYQMFWERALRWLTKDPEMKNLSLSSFKDKYQPGDQVNFLFQVQDSSYHPISSAQTTLKTLQAPQGCAFPEMPGEEVSPGKYQFQIVLNCPGGYRFQASAEKNGLLIGTDDAILSVEKQSLEMQDLSLRPDLMELVAQATDAKLLRIPDSPEKLKFPNLKQEEIIGAQDFPLWKNWLSFSVFILSFAIFWAVRRYYSLS